MTTHKCSAVLECKSKDCMHAKAHSPDNCVRPAPCGCWPGQPNFQPHVQCIPKENVKPRDDCPNCGEKEKAGHHYGNCIRNLKTELAILKRYLNKNDIKMIQENHAIEIFIEA